jgi:tetratricopeptide (TPR) repeat protein
MPSISPNDPGVTASRTPAATGAMPPRPGLGVPLDGPATERPDTLPGLGALLVPGAAVALVSEQGTGGPGDWRGSRGKTQAAAHAATWLRRSGAVDLVVWADASGRASLLGDLAAAAADAGLDSRGGAEVAAGRLVAWLAVTSVQWLVVLDDLREQADVAGLWPAGPAGITVVTTRDPDVVAGFPVALAGVGCFSPREAVAALSARLSTDPDHRSGQLDLVLDLDCEPAAIAHAAAVIATSELTCRGYHELFLAHRDAARRAAGREVPAPAVTWALSARHAEVLEPGADTWPLLVVASLLSPHGIPVRVLVSAPVCRFLAGAGLPPVHPGRAMAAVLALQAAGLMAISGTGPQQAARVSGPVQAAVRALAPPELLGQAAAVAADALAGEDRQHDPQSVAGTMLRSGAAALLSAVGDVLWAGGRSHRLLPAAGRGLEAAGMPGPAAAWWQQLAGDSARLLGRDHDETLTAASRAACALLAGNQPDQALAWAGWVRASREDALGPQHPGTLQAAALLGRALAAGGRTAEAVVLLRDTARASARALGPGHAVTLAAHDDLADACLAAGRAADAVTVLRAVVSAREESPGPDDPATWAAAGRLAAACLAAGKAAEAISIHQDMLARRQRLASPNDPVVPAALAGLAEAHGAAGHVSAALRYHQQAHAGYQRVLGSSHRDTLACATALAGAYAGAGQMTAALSVLDDAISLAGRDLPDGDPLTTQLRHARAELAGQFTAR